MSEIVEIDFGKETRDATRSMARLLGFVEEFEADFASDPKKYLDKGAAEVVRLRMVIEAARDALRPDLGPYLHDDSSWPGLPDTIVVDKAEWDRLKAVEALILAERP